MSMMISHRVIAYKVRATLPTPKVPLNNTKSLRLTYAHISNTLLQEHERLYFVKLDIEGAEFDIMDRLLDMKLYEKIDYIACETHERFFHDGKARIARLREKITKHGANNILLDWI